MQPYHKYTGPYNPLHEQLDEDDQPLPGREPYNNTSSTRNEIVYSLDELLIRKQISRTEYRDTNSYLSNKCRGDGRRQYYCGGSGIFDATSREMLSNGFKKATGARSVIAQKVADAVMYRGTSATQKAVEGAVNEAINTVTPYVKESVQKLISSKRPNTTATATATSTATTNTTGCDVKILIV